MNPFDPHRAETMDECLESNDVVVTVSTTKKAYDNYRWNEERIQLPESTIARFVKGLKGDTLAAVAGKYSMNAEQMDVFDSLNKEILGRSAKSKDARLREFRVVSRLIFFQTLIFYSSKKEENNTNYMQMLRIRYIHTVG